VSRRTNRTGSRSHVHVTRSGTTKTYTSRISGQKLRLNTSTKAGRVQQRSVRRAGVRGAYLGQGVGGFVLNAPGAVAGGVIGYNQARNVRIEKLLKANKKKTMVKKAAPRKSITAAHKGQTGRSGSTGHRAAGPNKPAFKPAGGGRKKKTNYVKDESGRFAGSK
jgi:hypothetical protein